MIIQSISHDFDKCQSIYFIGIENSYRFHIESFLFEYSWSNVYCVLQEAYIGIKIFLRDDIWGVVHWF